MLLKQTKERERIKNIMLEKELRIRSLKAVSKKKSSNAWQDKLKTSPFLIDLAAESKRVREQNILRETEDTKRQRLLEKRKQKLKDSIVEQAISQHSQLEELRVEKRKVLLVRVCFIKLFSLWYHIKMKYFMQEEKRVKALLDLERTKLKAFEEALVAQKAEKIWKSSAIEYMRSKRLSVIQQVHQEERQLNIEQLAIQEDPQPYGISVGKGVLGPLGGPSC